MQVEALWALQGLGAPLPPSLAAWSQQSALQHVTDLDFDLGRLSSW